MRYSCRFSESVLRRRCKQLVVESENYLMDTLLKILKYPMKHYSDILWYPIENVHTQFTKKVKFTQCPQSYGRLPFSRPYILMDEQKCVGINYFVNTYYFTLKYDDLQRTNPEYLEDETSPNWIPVGTGIYDTGSGKIHHRNKMAECVDITF